MRTRLRRLLGVGAFLAALGTGSVAEAAQHGGDYATMGVNMVILAVILVAIFLWLYSVVA
jgi:hypothetical protein